MNRYLIGVALLTCTGAGFLFGNWNAQHAEAHAPLRMNPGGSPGATPPQDPKLVADQGAGP